MPDKPWSPEKIKREDVLKAAKIRGKGEGHLNFKKSTKYDVVVDGQPYPPKAISSIAYFLATGQEIYANEFSGYREGLWQRRLRELGFAIVSKDFDRAVSKSLAVASKKRYSLIANQENREPLKYEIKAIRYERNPDVVAARLELAGGVCERCRKPAPFKRRRDNRPYLEVHHIKPLAQGGFDTLKNTEALCPNCHREVHDQLGASLTTDE